MKLNRLAARASMLALCAAAALPLVALAQNVTTVNGKPVPKKYPVIALIERNGEMRVKHVADVTAKTVRDVLVTQISRKSHLMTDDSLLYYWLGREFDKHDSVNHSKDEYVRGKAHVNSAESFFALLKRGVMGSLRPLYFA